MILAIAACSKVENPLLTANDGQFARLVEPRTALAPSCAAALYEPEVFVQQYNATKFSPEGRITAVSDKQQNDCVLELQKRASEIGMAGDVKPEHLRDDRVRQRYLSLKAK